MLLVDDERLVRRTALKLLGEAGHRVFEAATSDEALSVLAARPNRIDLTILDIVMPGVDGVHLGQCIAARWPAQRILYMSAHSAEVVHKYGLWMADMPFLAKPFTRDELLNAVAAALATAPPDARSSHEGREPTCHTKGRPTLGDNSTDS